FVVLLPDTDRDAAIKVAEAVREAVQAGPLIVGQLSIPVTVSVGVHSRVPPSQDPQGDQTADQMLQASDRAVYRAKAGGRNRVENES
ncbi:MAG: GGDEF domain-containing protein, partial [Tepidimonas sp.]|nr:GGDEF domain-containing protein [Tepidimonas sp.]